MNEKWAQFTDLHLVINCRAKSINDRDHKWLHCSSSLTMFVLEWGDISCHISHKLVPAFFVLEKLGDGFGVLRLVRRDVANRSHMCGSHIHPVSNRKDASVVGVNKVIPMMSWVAFLYGTSIGMSKQSIFAVILCDLWTGDSEGSSRSVAVKWVQE